MMWHTSPHLFESWTVESKLHKNSHKTSVYEIFYDTLRRFKVSSEFSKSAGLCISVSEWEGLFFLCEASHLENAWLEKVH